MWTSELLRSVSAEFRLPPETSIRGSERPRFANGHAYQSPADKAFRRAVKNGYIDHGGVDMSLWDGEVRVKVTYRRRYPESGVLYRNGEPDVHKPDVDNVAKAVMDALNGYAWDDDARITQLDVHKLPRLLGMGGDYIRIDIEYWLNTPVKERRR